MGINRLPGPAALLAAGLLMTVMATTPAQAAGGYSAGVRRCSLPNVVNESSGVASVSWSPDVVWTHNDSGDAARFFAVDVASCTLKATFNVTGAGAVDWEDMARSGTTLYFGDIGDNPSSRPNVTVYAVAEPGPGAGTGAVPVVSTKVFTYPDRAHNAETLLIDPTTGRLVIVTKTGDGRSVAYRAPESGTVLEKVADVTVPGIDAGQRSLTGGDATDGRVVVRTRFTAYEWDVQPGDTLAAALGRPWVNVALPATAQGEAVAYTTDSQGLWTTSEIVPAPLHLLTLAGAVGPEGDEPAPVVPEVPLAALLPLTAAAVGGVALVRRRRPLGAATH